MGVCDSKSLIVVSDELSMELDDEFLLEVCRVKLSGSSLLTLCNSGNSITYLFVLTRLYYDCVCLILLVLSLLKVSFKHSPIQTQQGKL